MNLFPRRAIAGLLLVCSSLTSLPTLADDMEDQITSRPSAMAMFGDAVLARPLLLAGTLGGTALFVASLPFTVLGSKVEEAANVMVLGIAKSTFTRCLGCTATQDAWKNKPISNNQ